MARVIKGFFQVTVFLLVSVILVATSWSNDMNFANTAKKELSKQEKSKLSRKEMQGETFYLQANVWNEIQKDILSTNFHRGDIIPVGSKVIIDRMKRNAIIFTVDKTGIQYNFVLARKHSVLDVFELFERYFSEKNILENDSYKRLNNDDKKSIDAGEITLGMEKDVAVMAYGYPPTHVTPSLDNNVWTYWQNRFRRMIVYFKDDKVVKIGINSRP